MRRLALALLALALVVTGLAADLGTFRFTLRHRDVRSVADRVAEELGPRGSLQTDAAANALTVSDEPARLDAVRGLLQMLDVPARQFAIQAEFGVLGKAPGAGILREGDPFLDATGWLESGRPVRSGSVVLSLGEGSTGESTVLAGYVLNLALEGYDPSRRRLGFSELRLTRTRDGRDLLRGSATLLEGEATVFLLAPQADPERCRLALTPTLLPTIVQREVP